MASKKITELPLITAISSSVGYGTLDYRSVIPVVVGGSTNQITVEDFSIYAVRHSATTQSNTFLGNQTITGNISVSGTSTLTGNTSVGGTLGVTGNTSLSGDASVGGNLVVAGRITAEEFHTEITTASVIYASGSTKFGDTIDDKHEITGSTQISGSFTLNGGLILNGTTFDISQLNAYTQSLKNEVGTIEAYTASVKETISQTLTYTQSLKETISQTLAYTASVKETITQTLAYTASVKNQLSGIEAYTASLKGAVLPNGTNLDVFGNLRVSGSTYFGDNASDSTIITGKVEVTGSVSSTGGNTADFIQLSLTPSGIGGTGKLIWDSTIGGVSVGGKVSATEFIGAFQSTNGVVSASAQITELPSIQQATASLAAFTGSIRAELGNVEAYTASLKETITQTLAYTASVKNEVAGIQSYTASVKETISQTLAYTQSLKETISQTLAYTASVKAEIGNIESYTASLKETITQTLAYTASVKNEVGGLEAFTASIRTELGNVEAYTASVKETISQTLAYTASVKAEIGNIEAYTASLKNAIVVNGTNVEVLGTLSAQQIHTTYTTSSVLYQSGSTKFGDTVDDTHQFTGSVDVSSNIVGRANVQANKFVFTDGVVASTAGGQNIIGTNSNILYLYAGTSGFYLNNQGNSVTLLSVNNTNGYTNIVGGLQIGSAGNDQNFTFGGTNSSIYWGVSGPARMYYNVGDIKISSAGATDVLTVQNIGGISVSGGITGSLLSTNGVVSSSQQIQNYNTFAVTGNSNTFSGTQTISGSVLVSGSIIPNVGAGSYTSSFSLGSSTNAWGDIWVGNGSVKFVNPSSGATASIALDANNQLSLENSSFTKGLKVTGSVDITGSLTATSNIITQLASDTSTNLFKGTFVTANGSGAAGSVRFGGGESGQFRAYMEAAQSWNGTNTDTNLNFLTTEGGVGGSQKMSIGSFGVQVTGSLKATKVYGTTTSLTSDFNSGGIISYGNGSTTKYTQIGYDTGSNAGWIQALTQGSSYDNLLLNANGGRVIVGSTSSDGYGFQVYGASSINGQVKYTQVTASSGYVNETKSVAGSSVSYYLDKDTGSSNGSSYTYFNIEGLSNANGTLAHIILRVHKDATGSAINTQAYVQINGQDLIGVTTASGTGAVTIIKTFTVVYNSALGWQIIGTVGTY